MSLQNGVTYCSSKISVSPSPTAIALESTLQQCFANLKDLLVELQELHIESENYKAELVMLKGKCDSKNCSGSEALKKDIESKDNKIQFAASVLTKLNETKNFTFLTEAFKILCGESSDLVMTAAGSQNNIKIENNEKTSRISPNVKKKITPKKVLSTSVEDVSFNEESISEIDGTPTAPLSPIIHSKQLRSNSLVNSMEVRDKKKCPENWSTPEAKSIKLLIKTSSRGRPGRGKLRQQRLPFTMEKPSCVVDLTSSPEFSRGSRVKNESYCNVQKLIKKESSENDDTILPSPTSGPAEFLLSTCKENQTKFKKPLLSLTRVKHEETNCPIKTELTDVTDMEDSINILNPNRFPINIKASPKKEQKPRQEDATHCESQASMSLLQHVDKLEKSDNVPSSVILNYHSPTKRPLAENINIANTLPAQDGDSSMSLLSRETAVDQSDGIKDNAKRKTPEKVEPVYKEQAVRKKAEKRALPAWCCDECESFFGVLYANDPERRAKQIASCSKHRGRTNPVRPKTPPGFWDPRWDVPNDTEEFNKRNNAV